MLSETADRLCSVAILASVARCIWFSRAISRGESELTELSQSAWTQLHQTWPGHWALRSLQESFNPEVTVEVDSAIPFHDYRILSCSS